MTARECAAYLRITLWTFRRLVRQGVIPSARVGGVYRFLTREINDWLAKGGTKGAAREKVPNAKTTQAQTRAQAQAEAEAQAQLQPSETDFPPEAAAGPAR